MNYFNKTFNSQFFVEQLISYSHNFLRALFFISSDLFKQLDQQSFLQQIRKIFKERSSIHSIFIIISISLTEVEYIRLNKADFAMTILLFFEVFILLSAKGFKKYFKKNLNKLDAIIVVAHIISYILESKNDHNIFNPLN